MKSTSRKMSNRRSKQATFQSLLNIFKHFFLFAISFFNKFILVLVKFKRLGALIIETFRRNDKFETIEL